MEHYENNELDAFNLTKKQIIIILIICILCVAFVGICGYIGEKRHEEDPLYGDTAGEFVEIYSGEPNFKDCWTITKSKIENYIEEERIKNGDTESYCDLKFPSTYDEITIKKSGIVYVVEAWVDVYDSLETYTRRNYTVTFRIHSQRGTRIWNTVSIEID